MTLQDSLKEREKEYQKLKVSRNALSFTIALQVARSLQVQHDKIKRKALLQPGSIAQDGGGNAGNRGMLAAEEADVLHSVGVGAPGNAPVVDVNAVIGGMEANGVSICTSRLRPFTISNVSYRSNERQSAIERCSRCPAEHGEATPAPQTLPDRLATRSSGSHLMPPH